MDDQQSAAAARIRETSDVIYNKYLEIFHTQESKTLSEKYTGYVSDTAKDIIRDFHPGFFENLLDSKECEGDADKLLYPLYRHLRSWVSIQVYSGIYLVISRKIVEDEKIEMIGDGAKEKIEKDVGEKFWNLEFDMISDALYRQLIIRDTDEAVDAVKRTVPGIDAVSVGFLKKYSGKLLWATVYGVLLASWTDRVN